MTTLSGPTLNLEHVQAAWQSLTHHMPLGPILTEKDYIQRVQTLDSLLDAIGTNEAHPLGDLLDLLATQIEAYERQQPTMPEATPIEVLRYLMEEHGLTQTDVAEELGGQSAVSAILRGKRHSMPGILRRWRHAFTSRQRSSSSRGVLSTGFTSSPSLDVCLYSRVRPLCLPRRVDGAGVARPRRTHRAVARSVR